MTLSSIFDEAFWKNKLLVINYFYKSAPSKIFDGDRIASLFMKLGCSKYLWNIHNKLKSYQKASKCREKFNHDFEIKIKNVCLKNWFCFLSFTSFYLAKENIAFFSHICETSAYDKSSKHAWQKVKDSKTKNKSFFVWTLL